MSNDGIDETLRTFSERDRLTLFRQLLAGLVIVMAVVIRSSPLANESAFLLGCIICALSIVPALIWARQMPYNYPFFEIFLATNLTSYGVPLVWESESVELFSNDVRTTAALCVIVFLVVAMVTFYGVNFRLRASPFWDRSLFENPSPKWLHAGMIATSIYVVVTTFYWFPSAEFVGILRASTGGIASACTFMLCFMWGRRELKGGDKLLVVLTMGTQFAIWSASLVLRQGASLVLLGLVGYFFGRRRVPWLAIFLCLGIFAVLNVGKYQMRANYWFSENRRTPGLADLGGFYADWVGAGFNLSGQDSSAKQSRTGTLMERTSLLHMLCLVITLSPEPVPYLNGETYWQTLGQFVPRYFWKDKPRGHISTYTLSIHYGLQNEEATQATTIAFGFLPEAFANFGMVGAVVIGIVFGAGFKALALLSRDSPLLSYGGMFVVLLTAWSYQTELTMSIWLTSLFQAVVATVGAIWVPRKMMQVDTQ